MIAEHGPGCIIVPVADHLRYSQFFTSFHAMRKPAGTVLANPRSSAITISFNAAVYQMPEEAEWAFFLGDDHVMGPDTLIDLLDMEVEVAVPLVCKRSFPFNLVTFRHRVDQDWIDPRTHRAYPNWEFYEPADIPAAPFKVAAAGSAGMLVRRHVFDVLEPPYFESTDGAATNEDLGFCEKVTAAGFDIWCNPQIRIGHILETVVWPVWQEGRLQIVMDVGNGKTVVFKDEPEKEAESNGNGHVVGDREQDPRRLRAGGDLDGADRVLREAAHG